MSKKLLLGTTNKGKQVELRALFSDGTFTLCTPQDIGLFISVAETGTTYEENALIKAKAFCEASGLAALADDTGLEVDALDGAPGLYSARFSPKSGATDADRRALLVSRLDGFPQPWSARFTCTMALALPDGRIFTCDGQCEGEITADERGESGFGYDRVFVCANTGRTMSELGLDEKNHNSHRAIAAAKMRKILQTVL